MSVGMYLVSDKKLNIEQQNNEEKLLSLNDLTRVGDRLAIITQLEAELGLNLAEIDPTEKIFMQSDEEKKETFSVLQFEEEGVIHAYTNKPYIYYFEVYDWENFYPALSEYLQKVKLSFELWQVWESEIKLAEVQQVELTNLSADSLAKIFDDNDYLNPIVGICR